MAAVGVLLPPVAGSSAGGGGVVVGGGGTLPLTPQDEATIALMHSNLARAANLVGALLGEPDFAPGGSSLHYQGTVRMGAADDGASVCDEHCRVWGVDHLYVSGNGVIPTSTRANPTLTTVATSSRAGDHLASTL